MTGFDRGQWRAHQAGFAAQRNLADALRGFEAISQACGMIASLAAD